MSTSLTLNVHIDEDANFTYHEHNGTTWVSLGGPDKPVGFFGSPELLRRLFTEALAALPEPAVVEAAAG